MRRPPSYSDSFLVIPYKNRVIDTDVYEEAEAPIEPITEHPWLWVTVFIFKGSFHILCISIFESTFYFLYVNKSEDAGIVNTINTYYTPLVDNCATQWTNTSRWLVKELFTYAFNQTAVDAAGKVAAAARTTFNNGLIVSSALYSGAALLVCAAVVGVVVCNKWRVDWRHVILENLMFIAVLAAYEFFFYNTIIYKYGTLSTPELNKYILDGLAACGAAP